MSDTQLDLFGEVERAETEATQRRRELEDWQALFERADWIAPWDCADGTPAGAVKSGWRCPDPDCRQVEPTAYVLMINHGFDPTVSGRRPFDGRCFRRGLRPLLPAAPGCAPRPGGHTARDSIEEEVTG